MPDGPNKGMLVGILPSKNKLGTAFIWHTRVISALIFIESMNPIIDLFLPVPELSESSCITGCRLELWNFPLEFLHFLSANHHSIWLSVVHTELQLILASPLSKMVIFPIWFRYIFCLEFLSRVNEIELFQEKVVVF